MLWELWALTRATCRPLGSPGGTARPGPARQGSADNWSLWSRSCFIFCLCVCLRVRFCLLACAAVRTHCCINYSARAQLGANGERAYQRPPICMLVGLWLPSPRCVGFLRVFVSVLLWLCSTFPPLMSPPSPRATIKRFKKGEAEPSSRPISFLEGKTNKLKWDRGGGVGGFSIENPFL